MTERKKPARRKSADKSADSETTAPTGSQAPKSADPATAPRPSATAPKSGAKKKPAAATALRNPGLPPQLQRLNLNAAGIDVGATAHFVAVPEGADEPATRKFDAFTADLRLLADWLARCGVRTVVMESTGVYWIPLFELLEERGFEVLLVDPSKIKHVPARKSDMLDCQWLQHLHTCGLLRGAFRPAEQVRILRSYLRQRAMLVRYAADHTRHMQKALEQMNIKLHHVISDVTGTTGMAIVRAILAGKRDPSELAAMRDPRCKNDVSIIAKSLEGNWREEHIFELRQAVELFDVYREKISACDGVLEACVRGFPDRAGGEPAPPAVKRSRRGAKNTIDFEVREHLHRMTGVDLTRIDGIDVQTALPLIGEIGLDMSRWPSEKHFSSWLGLCPGTNISGGKRLSSRTKPCANRAAAMFRMAAQSLAHSQSALGAYYRRMRGRLGPPQAITATAHKLARLVYSMLKHGTEYVDPGPARHEEQQQARAMKSLQRRAKELGCALVPLPAAVAPA